MSDYLLLCILSGLVILSYLLDILSHKIRVPSVILLIITGVIINLLLDSQSIELPIIRDLLGPIGNFGLILIVLEGALDIEITAENKKMSWQTLGISVVLLLLTAIGIAWLFGFFFEMNFTEALLHSIPISVISSAIAIPSVHSLLKRKKEFIVFESTYSDILGIMFFNFILANSVINAKAFQSFFITTGITVLASIVGTYFLLYLMNRLQYHVKFFVIIALLTLAFGLGKIYHLPTLLIIFMFGLVLNNYKTMLPKYLGKYLKNNTLEREVDFMSLLASESAFVVRTFFFVFFGMTIDVASLANLDTAIISLVVIFSIYTLRFFVLLALAPGNLFPETFIAPRGLITILLLMSIPAERFTDKFDNSLYLGVIVASLVVLTLGNLFSRNEKRTDVLAESQPYIGPITEEEFMRQYMENQESSK